MNKKIYLAIPAYDSRIDVLCMASILNNIKDLESRGYDVIFNTKMGDPYIDQARNWLVNTFLRTKATDMIFIDTDLAFDTDAIYRLMRCDKGVVGGVYPFRSEDQNGFPVSPILDENQKPVHENGLVECQFIPTGLMRINRSVFEALKPEHQMFTDDSGETKYFRTGQVFIHEGDTRWWGEDNYFCEICRRCGIKIYCDPMISFVHMGRLQKKGNYGEYLQNGGKWVDR